MTPAARSLISAFQGVEQADQIAGLLGAEGFDVEMIRVLAAWQQTEHIWKTPLAKNPPDRGMPTARSYAWLVSGWRLDYVAIADAAGVSRQCAQEKLAVLLGNRLIYPSGEMTKHARAALQSAIAKQIRGGAKKKRPAEEPAN